MFSSITRHGKYGKSWWLEVSRCEKTSENRWFSIALTKMGHAVSIGFRSTHDPSWLSRRSSSQKLHGIQSWGSGHGSFHRENDDYTIADSWGSLFWDKPKEAKDGYCHNCLNRMSWIVFPCSMGSMGVVKKGLANDTSALSWPVATRWTPAVSMFSSPILSGRSSPL